MERGYDKIIKDILAKIEGLPVVLVMAYLKNAHNLTANTAQQAIYAATRNRICYKKDEWIVRTPYVEIDSALKNKAKAFRLVLEFLPDSMNFICSQYPWLLSFTKEQFIVQVCKIAKDMELTTSMMIAQIPVPQEDRQYIKRIAILDDGCDITKIRAVGFSNYCTIDDQYFLKVVNNITPDEAWSDMNE